MRQMNQASSLLVRKPDGSQWARTSTGLATFGLAIFLFFPGLAVHESLHLVVINLVGGHGSLVVRPWNFALFDLSLASLHAQPAPALDLGRQLVVNFLVPPWRRCFLRSR